MNDSPNAPVLGLEADGRSADVYDEETFQYFLGLERKRAERSGTAFLLLLVEFQPGPGQSPEIAKQSADELFSAMLPCVRETDFIGWHQERRVVGVVLTQFGGASISDVSALVCGRISETIRAAVSPAIAVRLHVRAQQLLPSHVVRSI